MGRRHVAALAKAAIDVAAVCDTHLSALDAAGDGARRYTDWRELLTRESALDVVTIATNGPSHYEIAAAAAAAGVRHVLCEKPMSTSGRKAREMATLCEAAGTRLAVNMSRRFADRFIRFKRVLAEGAIGELRHVNVSVGAGGLGCIGTHYFDFVAWLADTRATWVVGEVDADTAPNVRGAQFRDPGGRGMVGYANGMTACFQLSSAVAIAPTMHFAGTDGYIEFDGWSPPARGRITIYSRPADQRHLPKTRFVEPELVAFDQGEPMDVVEATAACLRDLVGSHREKTADAGIAAVDTVMAFHLSSQRRLARVDLPLTGDDLDFDVPIT